MSDILYCHDGNRGASNWKGSASYFHVRDAIPVYYWPDNHGAYTLYATMKHWIQRVFGYTGYYREVAGDANWNKLRLNITGLMKEPLTFLLFAKNQIRALKDVGLHIEGMNVIFMFSCVLTLLNDILQEPTSLPQKKQQPMLPQTMPSCPMKFWTKSLHQDQ